MRRKSERTATKKGKASPEKKVEKVRRTRTRRNKQSTSSENESGEDNSPVREVAAEAAVTEPEQKPPSTPVKEDSPEDGQDQVWQVKAAQGSGDVGEIQKLKICLTRPPSTPERADKSPRSKRKHSRAASSSDASGVDTASEEKKKPKHRSKRSVRESKDDYEKNQDSQGEEGEEHAQADVTQSQEVSEPHKEVATDEIPMSTTNEEMKTDNDKQDKDKTDTSQESENQNKSSDADTTQMPVSNNDNQDSEVNTSVETEEDKRKSVEKSEVIELQTEDSKGDMLDLHPSAAEVEDSKEDKQDESRKEAKSTRGEKVSINEGKSSVPEGADSTVDESIKATNKNDVLEGSESDDRRSTRKLSSEPVKDKSTEENDGRHRSRELERSESTQSMQKESVHNGESVPIVVSRKRRWGTRSKATTQKSITISTDVLKDIIPDVKPVEFDEVIEEKKQHRRIEVSEKVERPILPKIVIDNTENVEQHRKEKENESANIRETNLSSNRRISIVKENDNVLTRPPSPPRHKQSNILFITNLVRPFTLPQLKNLLQRTGRISENGFWIDRIKSKCFVKYETEDQAVETRHALHGVTWPVSNPKTLQVDFSTQEAFDNAKLNEDTENVKTSTIPGTVEDWLREQDMKRERGELDKPWERKAAMREWDVGKNEKDKEKERLRREERPLDKRRHRTPERSPEPAKKFKKKEEEAPAKLLDDLFRKTKTTPCIYWLPLSAETIAVKEEQRRQHMLEHERRLHELRRTHRRH